MSSGVRRAFFIGVGFVVAIVVAAVLLGRMSTGPESTVLGSDSARTGPSPGSGEPVETFQWKMQSVWQAGSINQEVFVRFCERVGRMSGGWLTIEPLPVGTVVAYNETLDAVAAGLLDGQNGGTGYFAGKDAAFALLADLNGGYETPRHLMMWLEYGGGLDLARELYAAYGLHYIGGVPWASESIPAKTPIRTFKDFQGVKIRSPEGMGQEIFQRLGAAPVNLPGSEVYTALERGVVDAADWGSIGMNDDLGFHDIAPYPLYPGFHSLPMSDVAVSLERWEELPDDLKRIVELAVRTFALDMVETVAMNDALVTGTAAERGIEIVRWSADDRYKFREVAAEVWAEYAGRSEMARRIYDSHMVFLRRLGLLDG